MPETEPKKPKRLFTRFSWEQSPADLTLRDLFAAFALAGDMARGTFGLPDNNGGRLSMKETVHGAYAYADAMLAERERAS